ncbi:hypothetical protein P280DRAFT_472749 [Massarina eburnea CBS 473.64]|uniref:Uncharacterized protein n=1 Tax=Massarina eburnea CBS 473.64 TaxID=1395130 RepID=A0A6A6RRK2_9PLEO|nr:hypothetical protein P280DRAFT_472749 [Massarina eburnea CBS 473.64]
MALRRQNISPTATLLRNSRLFSLPNPLPPAISRTQRASDTATQPYPTHQAIATTPKSLARGDWGLKRPIPSRSRIVQTSNPVLQIKQLDTIEHVTDYDTAAAHVRTRQKWEELGIPMTKGLAALRERGGAMGNPDGAFEYRSDVTAYDSDEGLDDAAVMLETIRESVRLNAKEQAQARRARKENSNAPEASFVPYSLPLPDPARHNTRRWKYEGPWLPGMDADEFTDYVAKQLHSRRKEFNRVLVQYVKNEIYTTRQNESRTNQTLPLDTAEAEEVLLQEEKKWSSISKADIQAKIKNLRQEVANDPLTSKLFQRLIVPFLRLPVPSFKNIKYNAESTRNDVQQSRFDDEHTPLSTHPSSGLGYLRTGAYLSNHPILGPQAERDPVTARVLEPTVTTGKTNMSAILGVAGFVADDPQINSTVNNYALKRETQIFDNITPGGAKVPVLAQFGSVTPDGRIKMKVVRSSGAAVLVKKGELDDKPPVRTVEDDAPLREMLGAGQAGRTLDADSDQARSMIEHFVRQDDARAQDGVEGFEEGLNKGWLSEALRGEKDAPR